MWALFQAIRKQVKLDITVFIWDLLLLIATMLVATGITKEVMHPALPIIGALWVLATTTAIWHLGGVVVDTLFFARILETEIGKEFSRALNVFFMLGSTTVIFFSFFPVWKFWAGTILLPIVLIGIFVSSNLANKETNWNKFRVAYLWLAGLILLALAVAGVTNWFHIDIFSSTPETLRGWVSDRAARLALLGLTFLAISFIPMAPAKGLLKGISFLLIAAALALLYFPEIMAKGNGSGGGKSLVAQRHAPATTAAASRLPAGARLVKPMAPGDKIYLTRTRMDVPPPKFYAKFPDGAVEQFDTWPPRAAHRYASNETPRSYDFYVVLPPLQNYTTSPTDPAKNRQASNTRPPDCLLDKAFGSL